MLIAEHLGPRVDEKCFEPFCIPTHADGRERERDASLDGFHNLTYAIFTKDSLGRHLLKTSPENSFHRFIFSNAHNSFHCQVLIGLTKTISLHQGEHFLRFYFSALRFKHFLDFSCLIGGQTPWRGRSTIS